MLNIFRSIVRKRGIHRLVSRYTSEADQSSVLSELEDYKIGLSAYYQQDYKKSLENFDRVKTILINSQQKNTQGYYSLLMRMAQASHSIGHYKSTSDLLDEALDVLRANNTQNIILYEHYSKMLGFYMHTNIEKALLFAKSLMADEGFELVPYNFQNEYKFILGVI